jgi:hypothetical protein
VLTTENGGFEWENNPLRHTTLYSLYIADRSRLVNLGRRGDILTTKNGGSKVGARTTGTAIIFSRYGFAQIITLAWVGGGTFGAI